jgi:hypothetical protein
MTKLKLDKIGIPGAVYEFGGKIRRVILSDGTKIKFDTDPWKADDAKLIEISRASKLSVDAIEDAFLKLHDKMKDKPDEKVRAGKDIEKMNVSWEDAIKRDANGNPVGLNAEAIAILLAPNHARIGDVIFSVTNNIGDMLSEETLKIKIIRGLKTVGAGDMYQMNTYRLVRDQLLPIIPEGKMGSTDGFLPAKNGVIDIRQNKIVPTDGIYLKTLSVDFDPTQTACPKIESMLNNMFLPDQKELVLSILGASISGRRAQFILALSGAGRNGKSILREILEGLMMDLITTEHLENLKKEFVNGAFLGKKISWQTEVDSSRKLTEDIKNITGGTTIQVRRKFINGELSYFLQMVCVIDTNSPPHFEDGASINERMRFINMPHKFVFELTGEPGEILIDTSLVNDWQSELPAFLNILLPYSQYFLEHGRLKFDMVDTGIQLRERSNLISGFITEYCDEEEGETTSMATFHKYLSLYAKKMNVACPEIDQLRYKLRKDWGFEVKGHKIKGVSIRSQKRLLTEDV